MDESMVNFQLDLNEDIDHRAVANDCMKESHSLRYFANILLNTRKQITLNNRHGETKT